MSEEQKATVVVGQSDFTDENIVQRYREANNRLKNDVSKLKLEIKRVELEKSRVEMELYKDSDEGLVAMKNRIKVISDELDKKEKAVREKELEIEEREKIVRETIEDVLIPIKEKLRTKEVEYGAVVTEIAELQGEMEEDKLKIGKLEKRNKELEESNAKLNEYDKFEAMEL